MGKVYAVMKLLLVAVIVISTVISLCTEKTKAYDTWLTVTTISGFVCLILFVFDSVVELIM